MPVERGGETTETSPKTVEQLIDEGMADRAAWRDANPEKVDITAHPDYDRKWARPAPEYSAEELARGVQAEAEDVAAGLDGSDEIYTDENGDPLPNLPDPVYSSPAQIREGIMSSSLTVPEARQRFRELQPSAVEPMTETVRAEGGLQFERGEPQELPGKFGENVISEDDQASRLERAKRFLTRSADDWAGAGKKTWEGVEALLDRPEPTGAITREAAKGPYVYESPTPGADGGHVVAASLAFTIGVAQLAKKATDRISHRKDGFDDDN